MSKEEIEKGNKIIAEFMGLEFKEVYGWVSTGTRSFWFQKDDVKLQHPIDILKYHKSWDWLMDVVEKIEETDCNVLIRNFVRYDKKENKKENCLITHFHIDDDTDEEVTQLFVDRNNNKLMSVYNCCIKFINWHNENKKVLK